MLSLSLSVKLKYSKIVLNRILIRKIQVINYLRKIKHTIEIKCHQKTKVEIKNFNSYESLNLQVLVCRIFFNIYCYVVTMS